MPGPYLVRVRIACFAPFVRLWLGTAVIVRDIAKRCKTFRNCLAPNLYYRLLRRLECEQNALVGQLILGEYGIRRLVISDAMGADRGWNVGQEVALAIQDGKLAAAEEVGAGDEEAVGLGVVDVAVTGASLIGRGSHFAGLEVPNREVLLLGIAAAKHSDVQRWVDGNAIGIAFIDDVGLLDHGHAVHVDLVEDVVL